MPIRYPMTRERTGRRTGPRYRRVVDVSGLHGAAACSARSINMAMRYRDQARAERSPASAEIARLGMRVMALWARTFAGQIDQHDPRLDAANDERTRLIQAYCQAAERSAA
jgi:hypothetical protein